MPRLPVTTRQGVVLVDSDAITHAVLEDELVTVLHQRRALPRPTSRSRSCRSGCLSERFERVHRRALLNLDAGGAAGAAGDGRLPRAHRGGHTVEVSRQSARDLRKRLGLRKAGDE